MTTRIFCRFCPAAVVIMVALLTYPAAAQTDKTQGERFTALALNFDAPAGAASATVDINIDRWSTDAERDRLINLLLEKGAGSLLEAVSKLPRLGAIRTPDSIGYDLRFARRTPGPDGSERIVILTDRPIGFWEAANRPRSIDYPFTVIELHINRDGKGEGKLSIGTKIQADKDTGTIVLENYSVQPVQLSAVRRVGR